MSFFARSWFSQRGRRLLKSDRGRRSARPAFSRNRAPKNPLVSRIFLSSRSMFSGVTSDRSSPAENTCGSMRRMQSLLTKVSR